MNGSAIFVRGERKLPLSLRVLISPRITRRAPIFRARLPRRKRANIGGGHGNVARQSTSLMSKNVRGYSLNKHFIYGWAVVILIFEILPFSFRYDLLEFLFAKTYVCNVTAITTILYLPRIRSCIN